MEKYKIFISHISEEKEIAIQLKKAIEDGFLGAIEVFVSSSNNDIRLGDEWFEKIEDKLRLASTVILLLTPQSLKRPWVNFEAGGAWFLDRHMIPLCAGGLVIQDLPSPFNRKQAIDLYSSESVEKLFSEIASRSKLKTPTVDFSSLVHISIFSISNDISSTDNETEEIVNTVVDGLNWATVDSSEVFYERLCDAFPGSRDVEKYKDEEATSRLEILLHEPLFVKTTSEEYITPIWWSRGIANMHIERFERLGKNKILLNVEEMQVDHLVAVRKFSARKRNFVYVHLSPESPTGLYKYPDGWLEEYLRERHKDFDGYYFYEEYGLWNDKMITRTEYDDGAAIIDGKPTTTKGAKLRSRYITPYNFVVFEKSHVLNSMNSNNIDWDLTKILDEILLGSKTVNDLIDFVATLPRPKLSMS